VLRRRPGTTYAESEQGEIAVGPEALRELLERIFDRDESYSWTADRVWSSARGDLHMVMAELAGTVQSDAATADLFPYRLSGVLRVENDASRWLLLHGAEPTTFNSPAWDDGDRVVGSRGRIGRCFAVADGSPVRVSDWVRPSAVMQRAFPAEMATSTT
jgi:hypothetical protein